MRLGSHPVPFAVYNTHELVLKTIIRTENPTCTTHPISRFDKPPAKAILRVGHSITSAVARAGRFAAGVETDRVVSACPPLKTAKVLSSGV